MTPEEQKMLDDLASKIAQAPQTAIDPEADQLIKSKIGARPDALYLLTQTVLIQNMAIEQAHHQIQDLQQRLAQQPAAPQPGSTFLPPTPNAPPRSTPWTVPGYSAPPPPPPPATPTYSTPQPYAAPPPYAPPPQYGTPQPAAPSSGHSFLKTAAITAGGIAAGALVFEGVKSLFSGGHSYYPGSGFLGGGGGIVPGLAPGLAPGMAPSETIVNNYYDSPGGGSTRLEDEPPSSLRDDDIDDRSSLADVDDDRSSLSDDLDDSPAPDDSSYSGDGDGGDGGGDGGGGGDDFV